MRFDLGTLDSGERSLPFGLLVSTLSKYYWMICINFQCGKNQICSKIQKWRTLLVTLYLRKTEYIMFSVEVLCILLTKKNFGFNTVCSSTFFHFFIDTVHEWNNLSEEIKRSGNVNSFKIKLKSIYGPKDSHKLFTYWHGRSTASHCRMRLGLSHLQNHLFNYNLINTPYCENETSAAKELTSWLSTCAVLLYVVLIFRVPFLFGVWKRKWY